MNQTNIDIIHHGAVNGVTGSCHELQWLDETGEKQAILVDCGLFQGAEVSSDGSTADQLKITFPIDHIQALVVTHVHIDHVGRIPYLLAAGFKGPIYCSEASAELLPLVLEDALKVGFTRDKKLIERFLKKIKKQIITVGYGRWRKVAPMDSSLSGNDNGSVAIMLQRAGHILGSAYVQVSVVNPETGDDRVITFSGDLGPPNTPLLHSATSPEHTDVLVLESTYGDKQHESRLKRVHKLKQVIESTFLVLNGICQFFQAPIFL